MRTTVTTTIEHADPADAERRRNVEPRTSGGITCGTVTGDGPYDDLDDVLEDERHADGGDQRREPGRVPKRPVGEALDDDPERCPIERHREQEGAPRGRSTTCSGPCSAPSEAQDLVEHEDRWRRRRP